MDFARFSDRLFGWIIVLVILLQAIFEWTGMKWVFLPLLASLLIIVTIMAFRASKSGFVFLSVCLVLTVALVFKNDDWQAILSASVFKTGFLVSFFSALTILRNAASTSPAMSKSGAFLAAQPPGRRYISLSFGTQIFALLLNFGAIQLLGTLALTSAKSEPDERVRVIRSRRMLLAIQRGFVSSLTWSPMAFSTAMAVATIPGTSWMGIAMPGLVSSSLLLGTGWAMDTIFKPRSSGGARSRPASQLRWTVLLPLVALLVIILVPVLSIELLFGIRIVGIVLVVVPTLSIVWLLIQKKDAFAVGSGLISYVHNEVPAFRSDLLLLMSAGYIGVIGSALLVPMMAEAGIDLTVIPGWLLLISLVWIMPVMGQIGSNPILTLSLVAPMLPDAAAYGLDPRALGVALLCGWSLTGLTSPFTATNMMIGRFGGIPTVDVGRVWNRSFFFVAVTLFCLWSLIFGYWIV